MTGDRWFRDLPSGWTTKHAKRAVRCVDIKVDATNSPVKYVGLENVESWTGRFLDSASGITADGMANKYVRGDILFGKLRPYLAKVLETAEDGICSTEFLVLRPRDLTPRYLQYIMRSAAFIDAVNAWTYGVKMPRASWDIIGNLLLPEPPKSDQEAITVFLDRETAKADALVAKYERLIELLDEKRVALITQAVTKGLNPSAAIKSVGGWINGTPDHWSIERVVRVAKLESGHTPDKKIAAYWDGDIPWVSLNDTKYLKEHEYIGETSAYTTTLGLEHSSAHLLPAGSVVFSRDATIGRCAITTREMAVSQHFIAWVCGPRIRPEFLLYAIRSMDQELERLTFGATVKTIGMPDVKSLVIPVPPIHEQDQIVTFICEKILHIDTLMDKVRSAIALIREHRSALITAAITGQIDVRTYRQQTSSQEVLA